MNFLNITNPFSMVVAIVTIVMFASVLRELFRNRSFNTGSRRELEEIRQRITQIEADIGDIKEQIADFIIKQS